MKGKVALVTGGTGGIGRSTAIAFGRQGASVVVTGRREAEGNETVKLIEKEGGKALFVKADVTREADCQSMIEQTVKKFGRLDYAFNNAGTEGHPVPLVEETVENFNYTMNINVLGVMLSMKYEIPAMLKTGGGSIVNCASVLGTIAMPNLSTYNASKHAVLGYTKTAALELARQNIRVNAVSPAVTHTDMIDRFTGGNKEALAQMGDMHPMGRMGKPEEIASAVIYLCTEGAGFISGANLNVDGGLTAQ